MRGGACCGAAHLTRAALLSQRKALGLQGRTPRTVQHVSAQRSTRQHGSTLHRRAARVSTGQSCIGARCVSADAAQRHARTQPRSGAAPAVAPAGSQRQRPPAPLAPRTLHVVAQPLRRHALPRGLRLPPRRLAAPLRPAPRCRHATRCLAACAPHWPARPPRPPLRHASCAWQPQNPRRPPQRPARAQPTPSATAARCRSAAPAAPAARPPRCRRCRPPPPPPPLPARAAWQAGRRWARAAPSRAQRPPSRPDPHRHPPTSSPASRAVTCDRRCSASSCAYAPCCRA